MAYTNREKIIGIATASVIGALALDSLLISPLWARWENANRQIDTGRAELLRGQNLQNNQLRAKKKWRDVAGNTLSSDASAAESLVLDRVPAYARAVGLELDSFKPGTAEREKDFRKVIFRASANGTLSQLAQFVYALRDSDIPLRINDVQIQTRKDGTDDLTLQIGISTIYVPAPEPAAPGVSGARIGEVR